MSEPERPIRADGLEINIMHDGVVIYQRDRNKIHYLNHTAGLVLELCDGTHEASDLAAIVGETYGLPEPPHDDVASCLQELAAKELLR
ncbi:MAG: PqqD family protein [Xanthobacteraceae bacterium]|nr:PqqD family protein [Xanthobacteraceae bacterium]